MQEPEFEHTVSILGKRSRALWLMLGTLLLGSAVFGAVFALHTSQTPPSAFANLPTQTVTIPIEGMTCASCVARVKKTLQSIDGVTAVEVSLAQRTTRVSYREAHVSPEHLAAAINDLGYTAGTPTAGGTQ